MGKLGIHEVKFPLGDREITLEFGKVARQADGAVVLRDRNCVLLATVVSGNTPREGVDFLPLTVDYMEKFSAAGRFPGGFFKREGKLSDHEVLVSRLVDRALRPLFPDDYHADIQVMIQLLSADDDVSPDALAGLAASAAIALSDIPFNGPMAELRVARIDGEWKINPRISETERADINLIVAGTPDAIGMVEGEMREVSEDDVVEALTTAHRAIKEIGARLNELKTLHGKPPRQYQHELAPDPDLEARIHQLAFDKIYQFVLTPSAKQQRSDYFNTVYEETVAALDPDTVEEKQQLIDKYFKAVKREAVRKAILDHNKRLDGRGPRDIRPIECEVDVLPSVHGSALFIRGETQALASVTLGSHADVQLIDRVMEQGEDRFLLHYNFPGFSTGEVRPKRAPSRREIGHGNLARRAIEMVLPSEEDNPYVIRIISDILESNGSSSMATVCASSLALMDAGIPLKGHVSGIAMGLIMDKEGRYAVLSDILGDEDHLGDMDFKVTGTADGITALQMDLKVEGLPQEVLRQALLQAKEGRDFIRTKMEEVLPEPRPTVKPFAPKIIKVEVPRDVVGAIIGPGGKHIQALQAETGTVVSIVQEDDPSPDATAIVEISGKDAEMMEKARQWIEGIAAKPEVGKVYQGTIKSIMPYGAFVEYLPGKEGLLHISEIRWEHVPSMEETGLKEGDRIDVKLVEIDDRSGKVRLSMKVLTERPEHIPERPARERRPRSEGHGRRDNRRSPRGNDRRRPPRRD